MAGLEDLIAQIPIQDIASKLGADSSEVSTAVAQLVPALVGGLQVNVQDGQVLVVSGDRMVEVQPQRLHPAP